ncbi:unnamed protein product [Discosporangium mesarthrocarpum]
MESVVRAIVRVRKSVFCVYSVVPLWSSFSSDALFPFVLVGVIFFWVLRLVFLASFPLPPGNERGVINPYDQIDPHPPTHGHSQEAIDQSLQEEDKKGVNLTEFRDEIHDFCASYNSACNGVYHIYRISLLCM